MIQELFKTFLRHAEYERGLSLRTISGYKDTLHLFLQFIERDDLSPSLLSTELIRNFLYYGKEERSWSNKTYHIHYDNLNAFCKWLVVNEYLKKNPIEKIQKPKISKPMMNALKNEEVHKILYMALLKSASIQFLRLRNHAILMLALHSGLRMSEVINLELIDVNFEENMLHVRCGKGAKDRMVIMTEELSSNLRMYIQEHEKFFRMKTMALFPSKAGKRLNPREFRRITDKISDLAEIKFASHDLRRTYATNLSRNNVSPFIMQQQLGHADIRVTMRYVCHDTEERMGIIGNVRLY